MSLINNFGIGTDMKRKKLNIIFYLIHPAKFNQCRFTINNLISNGHNIEIIIIGRSILEELVKNEGWKYNIIFPKGRKIKGVSVYISSAVLLFPTIFKLFKLTWGKKYDLFITDDLISYVGKIKGIPTMFLADDDISAVPLGALYFIPSIYIFSPSICYLAIFKKKKIGYYGYKALAHLHPNVFKPDRTKIDKSLQSDKPFFYIRTVQANSKHDVGKSGIGNDLLRKLIDRLKDEGNIVLNSERELPDDLKKYQLDYNKNDVAHYLYYAKMVIGDSTTMSAEAAVLGTPSIEIDDWFADFKQYAELSEKYNLLKGFKLDDTKGIFALIDDYLGRENLEDEFHKRRDQMLADKIDVSAFLLWIIENYPDSVEKFMKDPNIQLTFK